ncbi:OmpA family protein [Nocardiopsis exhalans]|uniref:OmpA family protein n=1 Tax=Nocardiopsis exhalans TaxID=163604 RepID=A0ABY5D1P8_9ACTN|nr:OmpA family protein [Nocardiopsis exhalans]USY17097.1 OmpA family protein [Nocardiopsis exhalans]
MSQRALGVTSAVLALSMALSSCGLIRDLTSAEGEEESPTQETVEEVSAEDIELPFVRTGRMFVEGGNDVAVEMTIDALEHNGEYLMLDLSLNILEFITGEELKYAGAPLRLVDPVSGEVLEPITSEEHGEPYGTYFIEGSNLDPIHETLPQPIRRYFPAPSEDVEFLTLTGATAGHVPGTPVSYVDEFTPLPEPDVHDYIDPETWVIIQDLPEDEIVYPETPPEPGLETDGFVMSMESFVDSPTASTTRAGDEEVIALHADNMFEFDESDPTDEAVDTIQEAAQSMRENLGEGTEITIIGHTDGKGADDYNQDLSQERAEAVRDLLKEELGTDFTLSTEGRGSDEPVAEEGGDDDEEARARNRRVEFQYEVPMSDTDSEEGDSGLDAAKRHVGPPAPYFEELDPFTTVTHEDLDLNVYPMVRDGAYLFQMVGFQNSTLSDLEADLEGDEASLPGSPQQYTEGTMGGFRLEEPGNGLIRYVIRIRDGEGEYEDFADEIFTLSPGEEYLALSVFPAPGPEVEEMTLYAGAFGEIPGVPVQ